MRLIALSMIALATASSVLSLPTTRFSSSAQRRAQIARLHAIQRRAQAPSALAAVELDAAEAILSASSSSSSAVRATASAKATHKTNEAQVYAAEVKAMKEKKQKAEKEKKEKEAKEEGRKEKGRKEKANASSHSHSHSHSASHSSSSSSSTAPATSAPTAVAKVANLVELEPATVHLPKERRSVDERGLPQVGSESTSDGAVAYAAGLAAMNNLVSSVPSPASATPIDVQGFAAMPSIGGSFDEWAAAEGLRRRALPTVDVTLTTKIPATIKATYVPVLASNGVSSYANILLVKTSKTTVAQSTKGTTTSVVKTINVLAVKPTLTTITRKYTKTTGVHYTVTKTHTPVLRTSTKVWTSTRRVTNTLQPTTTTKKTTTSSKKTTTTTSKKTTTTAKATATATADDDDDDC